MQPILNLSSHIQVKHSSDKFYFTVETTGALKPTEVVRDAIRQLAEKIRLLKVKTMNKLL